jgi:nucleotide-binding universal stress UspA family protein
MPAKILIAVDSSEQQLNSFRPVYDIAALFGSSVFLASYVKDGAEAHELVTRLHHLQSFCSRLNHVYPGLSTETASIDGTDFHEALRQYIIDNGIHLLVMVTRERSFWQQVVDSSATQKMSYHIEVPLLSLHHD